MFAMLAITPWYSRAVTIVNIASKKGIKLIGNLFKLNSINLSLLIIVWIKININNDNAHIKDIIHISKWM